MVIKKSIILLLINFTLLSTSHSQADNENHSIFKLATTPFIHKANVALSGSYGFNYGNPSLNIQEWFLPNESKDPLFNYTEIRLSFGNRISLFAGYSKMSLIAYNDPENIHDYTDDNIKFGAKLKLIKSNGYSPAVSIELNSDYAISLSIGSTENKLKYYGTLDCTSMYYIIPIPILLSTGISYEILNNLNLSVEGSFNRTHGNTVSTQSVRTGINYSLLNYLNFDIGLFYFGFDYEDTVPGGISGLAKKEKYFLLSGGVTVDFSLFD